MGLIGHAAQATAGPLRGRTRALRLRASNASFCPRPCENHSAGHLGARLIQTERRPRIKDSPRMRLRFYCCARTTASSVFTQPRAFPSCRGVRLHRQLGADSGRSRDRAGTGMVEFQPVIPLTVADLRARLLPGGLGRIAASSTIGNADLGGPPCSPVKALR
jgi:hypothetical protein